VTDPGGRPPDPEGLNRLERDLLDLRASRRRLVAAADADRQLIERDLHDGLQQQLVALAVELRRVAQLMDDDPPAARTLLEHLAGDVRAASDEASDLAQRVYPPLLDGPGLGVSLRAAAAQAGVTLSLEMAGGDGGLGAAGAPVYWACAEALASAPPGSHAGIVLAGANGGMGFEIEIAGRLTPARIDRLRDRIEALDGRVGIEPRPDGGSRIQGWLPTSD
jgi:signal transduction histidine kinase